MGSKADDYFTAEIRNRVFQIKRLATMPQVIWQLMDTLADDRSSASTVEKVIESDPALASKVLSLANSAYYSPRQEVVTIERAVVIIGYEELYLLAVGATLAEVFNIRSVPAEFDGEGLWLHCLAVSWLARELAVAACYPAPMEIMVAGLLHDLGKLVLATYLKKELNKIINLVKNGVPYYLAEEQFGLGHTSVGYWLARHWSLPESHTDIIRDHHTPRPDGPHFTGTCLVLLADQLVKALGIGLIHKARPVYLSAALEATNLTKARLRTEVKRFKREIPALTDRWKQILGKGAR